MRKLVASTLAVSTLAFGGCASQAETNSSARSDLVEMVKKIDDNRTLFETRYIEPFDYYYALQFKGGVVTLQLGEACLAGTAFDTRKSATITSDALGRVVVASSNGKAELNFDRQGQVLVPDEATKNILTRDNPCMELPDSAWPVKTIDSFNADTQIAPISPSDLQQ